METHPSGGVCRGETHALALDLCGGERLLNSVYYWLDPVRRPSGKACKSSKFPVFGVPSFSKNNEINHV